MRILLSAGPTRESLDPVRFLSNRSTGKMGYALARAAVRAGHETILVSGPVSLPVPEGLFRFLPVESAADMAEAMKEQFPDAELTIMCAAVADYRPVHCAEQKIKKSGGPLFLELERTEDILLSLGQRKRSSQILVGFAAETQDLALYAQQKLRKKNLDWIIANEVGLPSRGFASDFNAVTVYGADGSVKELPLMEKERLAEELIRFLVQGAPLF